MRVFPVEETFPKIEIVTRLHAETDPNHYQANALFPNGQHCHAIAPTPAEALRDMALYWIKTETPAPEPSAVETTLRAALEKLLLEIRPAGNIAYNLRNIGAGIPVNDLKVELGRIVDIIDGASKEARAVLAK